MIIDEHTGRLMENRSWERGLHQLIEIKENCEITKPRSTLAKISYQGFFKRYQNICGMTGTAHEVKREFKSTYGLEVISIPPNRSCKRTIEPVTIAINDSQKWEIVLDRIIALNNEAKPVLVGTHHVSASEILSEKLNTIGLKHHLLNAKQDENEAEIISMAGQAGQITIATNMAGRGTDIKINDRVKGLGGLHVILTELHDAGRIDRQLEGRCARQGDPGHFQMILSLDDHLVSAQLKNIILWAIKTKALVNILTLFIYRAMKVNQWLIERKHKSIRAQLLKIDKKENELLAFSGREH
jgi:preprotein translocase subunit SecA